MVAENLTQVYLNRGRLSKLNYGSESESFLEDSKVEHLKLSHSDLN